MSADLEMEPIPGLPAELPAGERILWQGRPSWRSLARQALKIRWLAGYFAVLFVFRVQSTLAKGGGLGPVVIAMLLGGACLGMVALFAWLQARGTVYTLTTRRIVMRFGVALPVSWNLPFKRIASAEVSVRSASDGDVVFELVRPDKIAWLHLWPHVKPGNFSRPLPAFRAIADADHVSRLVASAVQAWAAEQRTGVVLGAPDDSSVATVTNVAASSGESSPAIAVHSLAEGIGR